MKRVLITGANRGVGFELARQCVQRGDRVFAGCRSPVQASALENLSTNYPGRVTILPLDVTDESRIDQSLRIVHAEVESLDILFNNAAVYADGETIKTFQAADALYQVEVNAVGQLLVTKRFVDLLMAGDDPKIVNISSEAGSISEMKHFRGYYYFASKTTLNMFTRSLAWDPETKDIIVIAIHPGWVRTDMGGPDATTLPEDSAAGILRVTDRLTMADNGKFYTWKGREYPW